MQKNFCFKEEDQTAFLLTDDKFHKLLGGCVETCGEETFRFTYPEPKPFTRAFKNAMITRLKKNLKTGKTKSPAKTAKDKRHLIATLVRINSEGDTYVSRSFTEIDDKAIETIRGCISEDCEVSFTPEEIEKCYLPAMDTLKEDFAGLPEDRLFDFEHEGTPVWQYDDEVETITYVLHLSILE